MGLGMTDFFIMAKRPHFIASVPCDIVANAILVLSMTAAKFQEPKVQIFHCTSDGTSPCDSYGLCLSALDYLKYNPMESAVRENINFQTVQSFEDWKKLRKRRMDLPA
jgi:hypothetical protein